MTGLILRPADVAAGERWTLDLDVAKLAKLTDPHSIRRTIEEAIKSNDIRVPIADRNDRAPDPTADRISEIPAVRAVATQVPAGGGHREVTEYHLDDAAVILILTRLRTPEARKLVPGLLVKLANRERLIMAALPTMLAAAREEGLQAGRALSAADVARIDALERAAARPALLASSEKEMKRGGELLGRKLADRLRRHMGDPDLCPCSQIVKVTRETVGSEVRVTARCAAGHVGFAAEAVVTLKSDPLQSFLASRPVGERTHAARFYADYQAWCARLGAVPISGTMFGRIVSKSPLYERRGSSPRTYIRVA